MHLHYSAVSDKGMRRSENQDNLILVPELSLFGVADGMGGHQGGQVASTIARDAISDYFKTLSLTNSVHPLERIQKSILSANSKIQEKAQQETHLSGMGTTTTLLFYQDKSLWLGHVGDSRCYLFRNQQYWQLTRDHSLVQEKLRAGLITREQLKTDKMRNVITRSVGFEPQVEIDIYTIHPKVGDVFILCSDGLSTMIEDEEIFSTLHKTLFEEKKPDQAAQTLVDLANARGGEDNVSVVVIRFE